MQIQLRHHLRDERHWKGGSVALTIKPKCLAALRQAVDRLESVALIKSSDQVLITVMHSCKKQRAPSHMA